MEVVCIETTSDIDGRGIKVIKGRIYHVIGSEKKNTNKYSNITEPAGEWYTLIEFGDKVEFHYSLFVVIEDDHVDETELLAQREQQLQNA